ncbi:F-box only protein 46-like [Acipenser oxyrinchus oxyrinchus]|uniref:F-box only protein 46-like n=1 Tax=Acipenser oxyrinchus oxyrinchus TaxID=40147 RepID=A0AAD8CP95_ACIOX|nr:F-box only protein 46-like [Acipenser oxyrinchus oxyrinchus]
MMDPDTFSHIRLWCPRPFGTYSQNKPSNGAGSGVGGSLLKTASDLVCRGPQGEEREEREEEPTLEITPPVTPPSLSSNGNQVEDGRVLLDTWYVIKPGNTKEKIAFFVAHQCNGLGLTRPNTMKVKGNWSTDCSKAKRRRCSSYDPSKSRANSSDLEKEPGESLDEGDCLETELSETELLSVAEMVALVEQRTAMALQEVIGQVPPQSLSTVRSLSSTTTSTQGSEVFLSEGETPAPDADPPSSLQLPPAEREPPDSRRVAEAIAHFESQQQQLESALLRRNGVSQEKTAGGVGASGGTGGNGSGGAGGGGGREVRIAFRVSSMDPCCQAETGSSGRPNCMFLSCGGGSPTGGARAKEKITCDLYQLVSPSSRDPLPPSNMEILLAAASSPKGTGESRGEGLQEHQIPPTSSDSTPESEAGEKGGERLRECVSGFHVEVVVTGAVDQCVFYGKDSTENVKEETVCFTVGSPAPDSLPCPGCEENPPPPGQLFFYHTQTALPDEDSKQLEIQNSLDCTNNNRSSAGGERLDSSDSPTGQDPDSSDTSLCRLYRHISHDFLEIRFKIQRLLEPRQYMLLMPDHIMVNVFSYLPTRSLAALKCTCHYFKALIETYGICATDSLWNKDPLYRDDPCKQCKKHNEKGDVSLCRWHPKPYHHDLPYGRSYWMCCRRTDKEAPGCRVGLHDNNWVQPCELVQNRAKREDGR